MKEIPEQKGIMRGLGYKQSCVPKYVTGPRPWVCWPAGHGHVRVEVAAARPARREGRVLCLSFPYSRLGASV